jgi:hypothetical protein
MLLDAHPDVDPDTALALAGAVTGIALLTVRWDTDEETDDQLRRLDAALERRTHGFA